MSAIAVAERMSNGLERVGLNWFAPMVRLVDRGDPFSRPSDIGAMELYGTPIVGSDPYEVMSQLR